MKSADASDRIYINGDLCAMILSIPIRMTGSIIIGSSHMILHILAAIYADMANEVEKITDENEHGCWLCSLIYIFDVRPDNDILTIHRNVTAVGSCVRLTNISGMSSGLVR